MYTNSGHMVIGRNLRQWRTKVYPYITSLGPRCGGNGDFLTVYVSGAGTDGLPRPSGKRLRRRKLLEIAARRKAVVPCAQFVGLALTVFDILVR